MNTAHNEEPAGTIVYTWSSDGFDLVVTGHWPTAMQLAEMIAALMIEYRKQVRRGN